jgi:hypothetical protein
LLSVVPDVSAAADDDEAADRHVSRRSQEGPQARFFRLTNCANHPRAASQFGRWSGRLRSRADVDAVEAREIGRPLRLAARGVEGEFLILAGLGILTVVGQAAGGREDRGLAART